MVGMACKFPEASNYSEFWNNLAAGRNSIAEIPITSWDINKYYSSNIDDDNKSISKWCGIIQGVDKFDSKFFNISPREANNMDPQQRLLLEETVHCDDFVSYILANYGYVDILFNSAGFSIRRSIGKYFERFYDIQLYRSIIKKLISKL